MSHSFTTYLAFLCHGLLASGLMLRLAKHCTLRRRPEALSAVTLAKTRSPTANNSKTSFMRSSEDIQAWSVTTFLHVHISLSQLVSKVNSGMVMVLSSLVLTKNPLAFKKAFQPGRDETVVVGNGCPYHCPRSNSTRQSEI